MEREYAYFAGYLIYTGLFTGKGKFLSCGKAQGGWLSSLHPFVFWTKLERTLKVKVSMQEGVLEAGGMQVSAST